MVAKKKSDILNTRTSESVSNYLEPEQDLLTTAVYSATYTTIRDETDGPPSGDTVAWFTTKLGKYDFIYYGGEYRYRVWERKEYRLFVANGYGFKLEFFPSEPVRVGGKRNRAEAWAAFEKLYSDIGLALYLTDPDLDVRRMPGAIAREELIRVRDFVRAHMKDQDMEKLRSILPRTPGMFPHHQRSSNASPVLEYLHGLDLRDFKKIVGEMFEFSHNPLLKPGTKDQFVKFVDAVDNEYHYVKDQKKT